MSTAKFDGIIIPCVYAISITRELVGERARTAAGKLRQDVVAIKRSLRGSKRAPSARTWRTLCSPGWTKSCISSAISGWMSLAREAETVKAYMLPDSVEEAGFNSEMRMAGIRMVGKSL